MKLHSTRRLQFRLAFRQTVWFALLFALLAGALYAFMERRLYNEVDVELQDRAIGVRSMLQIRNGGVTWLKEQADPEVRERFNNSIRYYQILDTEGRVLDTSGEFSALQLPISLVARQTLDSGRTGWETFSNADGLRLRILDSQVLGPQGRHYLMRIGVSLADADEDVHLLGLFMLLLFPVVIFVQGLICWLMTGSALRPLQQLSAAARQIRPNDLHGRLPLPGTGDEVEQLSATLNTMISGFQNSFQRMSDALSNLAHELRQPLTVLRAETEQALRIGNLREDSRQMLSRQLEHVELLGRTVSDLLSAARAESGGIQLERATEHLEELVRAAVDGMRMTAGEHGVSLSGHVQENVVGEFDAGQIWRLVLNLIDNAIKFNHPGGRVDVVLTADHNVAVISITDTGCGIAAEEQQRIFDRSYRAAAAKKSGVRGSGLGLHFARSIAEAHGGRIEVTSTPGEGSCFKVMLPLLPRQTHADMSALSASGSSAIN